MFKGMLANLIALVPLVGCSGGDGTGDFDDGQGGPVRDESTEAVAAEAESLGELSQGLQTTVEIKNVNSGRCVGVDRASVDPGAAILQFTCDGALNQGWVLDQFADNTYNLRNQKSGRCITPTSGDAGAILLQQNCSSSALARWGFVTESTLTIRNAQSRGLCIGVDRASLENGAQLAIFACDGRRNQAWELKFR